MSRQVLLATNQKEPTPNADIPLHQHARPNRARPNRGFRPRPMQVNIARAARVSCRESARMIAWLRPSSAHFDQVVRAYSSGQSGTDHNFFHLKKSWSVQDCSAIAQTTLPAPPRAGNRRYARGTSVLRSVSEEDCLVHELFVSLRHTSSHGLWAAPEIACSRLPATPRRAWIG